MSKFGIIWYDLQSEKGRDIVDALDTEDAIVKAFKLYNGNPPAPRYSIITNPQKEDGWNI